MSYGPERIARAWATLMERLGYQRYAAQGGDWGAIIVDQMGVQAPQGLIGIRTNMAGAIPPEVDAAAFAGAAPPAGLDEEETFAFEHVSYFYKHGLGYALEMGNRPQTLYGIQDSPVGLAAWILDHDMGAAAGDRGRSSRRVQDAAVVQGSSRVLRWVARQVRVIRRGPNLNRRECNDPE